MNSTFPFRAALVIGLDESGLAAARCLQRGGVRVLAIDAGAGSCPTAVDRARAQGIEVRSAGGWLEGEFELAVVGASVSWGAPILRDLRRQGMEVISELELGYRQSMCLNLAVAGTHGKTSVSAMLARVLEQAGRSVMRSDADTRPFCEVVGQSRTLDYLIIEAEPGSLEGVKHFRPTVGILLNLAPQGGGRWATVEELAPALFGLYRQQQNFDWAIVQSEAMRQLKALGYELPSKVITFSATDPDSDLGLDRGLLLSRLPGWAGPLLDIDTCKVRGPHSAENLMAVLAAGHVLRVPLDDMVRALRSYAPEPGCYEWLGRHEGVEYVNDGGSNHPEALRAALQGIPTGEAGVANVWLIAGGADDGHDFHDLGPLIARRVKHAFLLGSASYRMQAAWNLFTPCTAMGSLLEAVENAAHVAVRGDSILFSPGCSCDAMFSSPQLRGEAFRRALAQRVVNRRWERATPEGTGTEKGGSGKTGAGGEFG
jgi:UDP-N-acetylmuramoylalanine--D-glutamate ligase